MTQSSKENQQDVEILNIYATKQSFIKETPVNLKSHIDYNTVMMGELNSSLSPIDKLYRQTLNRDTQELNNYKLNGPNRHLDNTSPKH